MIQPSASAHPACSNYTQTINQIAARPVEYGFYTDLVQIEGILNAHACSCGACIDLHSRLQNAFTIVLDGWDYVSVHSREGMLRGKQSLSPTDKMADHIDDLLGEHAIRMIEGKRAYSASASDRTIVMRPIRTRRQYLDALWAIGYVLCRTLTKKTATRPEWETPIFQWMLNNRSKAVRLRPKEWNFLRAWMQRTLDDYNERAKKPLPMTHALHKLIAQCEARMA